MEDRVQTLRLKGNQYFSSADYRKAIECYSDAMKIDSLNAILYSNRALAYIKLQKYLEAKNDCDKAIQLDDRQEKAYFRRGIALKELKQYKSSLNDFQQALSIDPKNQSARKELIDLEKFLAATKSITIEPIQKSEELRSSLPLETIRLSSQESRINPISDDLSKRIDSLMFQKYGEKQNIQNFVQFEKTWRELSNHDLKRKFLENINLQCYASIFNYPIGPQILYEIIDVLNQSEKLELVFEILIEMTKVPRFDLNILLLSAEEKKTIKDLFTKFETIFSAEKIKELAKQFN
ncbi:RNA polymerase II-associated protein 3 [Sarcoptes scabiei]|uniref:RNA polymerase II-associated protein 3 n=1 Tax=Sarcoptes scabiei TaxID=52283 RepID=A0A834R4V8_SARSC|nr:RNA polymerase II-associated protein 3 [Sarcoptes scabiei]